MEEHITLWMNKVYILKKHYAISSSKVEIAVEED